MLPPLALGCLGLRLCRLYLALQFSLEVLGLPINIEVIHLPYQEEQIFAHVPGDTLVLAELRDLTIWNASDTTLDNLPTCGQQVERIHIELQARKQFWSIANPVAYRTFLPVSDFQENLLVLAYLQPIGKDFCQFFASSSRDSSRN